MFNKIFRAINYVFFSIVLISILLAGWTFYVVVSQPLKSGEIYELIKDMYQSQKSFAVDIIDLSKTLIEDRSENIVSEPNNIQVQEELVSEEQIISQEDKTFSSIDNEDNSLGIVIEPSEESLEDIDNQEIEFPINDMEMDNYDN